MSLAMSKSLQVYEPSRNALAVVQPRHLKVLIPYDGSDGAEAALRDLERAGLPQKFEALIAVTDVWLPSSPYEITRAVDARRLKLLTSGISSFAPARRDGEEQRVLSREADRRLRSMFPSANVTTEILEESTSIASDVVRLADSYGIELIVIGAKGSPSPHIKDYAATALRMARSTDCSVRIARPSAKKASSPAQILVAADETKSIEQVVKVVSERVWPAGTSVNIVAVKYGQRPEDLLLEHAKEISADCIFLEADILAHGQRNGDTGGLSKVAQSVILGAPCSVEIVRPKILTREPLYPAA